MKKKLGVAAVLLVLLGGGFHYYISYYQHHQVPVDFDDSILMRSSTHAMGAQTVTVTYKNGHVVRTSDFPDQNITFNLSNAELSKLSDLLASAGTEVHKFKPEPGVLYEGGIVLEVNVQNYIRHTSTNDILEQALLVVQEASVAEVKGD